jgi:hypothetical protein
MSPVAGLPLIIGNVYWNIFLATNVQYLTYFSAVLMSTSEFKLVIWQFVSENVFLISCNACSIM